jgi:hypothetical protein
MLLLLQLTKLSPTHTSPQRHVSGLPKPKLRPLSDSFYSGLIYRVGFYAYICCTFQNLWFHCIYAFYSGIRKAEKPSHGREREIPSRENPIDLLQLDLLSSLSAHTMGKRRIACAISPISYMHPLRVKYLLYAWGRVKGRESGKTRNSHQSISLDGSSKYQT